MLFSEQDNKQFRERNISLEEAEKQITRFIKGFSNIHLQRPAILKDGIKTLNENEKSGYIKTFDNIAPEIKIIKFIPSSGAATRMFQPFFKFLELQDTGIIQHFIEKIEKIAFYDDLKKSLQKADKDINCLIKEKKYTDIINRILESNGLNYKNLPKGLIKFHQYKNNSRTAFEEHIIEAIKFCKSKGNDIFIHFTVSPEHYEKFIEEQNRVFPSIEKYYNTCISISYSFQETSTDTIAVNLNNEPFRLKDGSILFRPGGHGALLHNLNNLDADLIFIKNIDNIAKEELSETSATYKKITGGMLITLKEKIHNYLKQIGNNEISENLINNILGFLQQESSIHHPDNIYTYSLKEKAEYCYLQLNRPIRVCGMVKNEGEPGGGPFWIKNADGSIALQIVESAQIDNNNKNQIEIFNKSTHFNTVDIACCIKDYKGNKFDLSKFIDENTGFIAEKNYQGKKIKALELPGLWNGSMAKWITVFIEVPKNTFTPVKTVFDLLNEGHQN